MAFLLKGWKNINVIIATKKNGTLLKSMGTKQHLSHASLKINVLLWFHEEPVTSTECFFCTKVSLVENSSLDY